jgi:hypothetical protein
MPVNFDNAIPFSDKGVAAIGPEDSKEKIQEICVWIYQLLPDGTGDVAATEMTTHEDPKHPGHKHFLRVDGADADKPGRWLLPLKKVGRKDLEFTEGLAFAIGIALVKEADKPQRVEWWGRQVKLRSKPDLVDKAIAAVDPQQGVNPNPEDVLKVGGALAEPLAFKPTD